ncbi:MAG: YerC/YecD family TrpR-related protein [Clostridia bacterium]
MRICCFRGDPTPHRPQTECSAFFRSHSVRFTRYSLIARRMEVAPHAEAGCHLHGDQRRTGASTATISRVSRCLIWADGYNMVLERLELEKESRDQDSTETRSAVVSAVFMEENGYGQ